MAEVLVTLANDDGSVLPGFADQETLEISRRIERESVPGQDPRSISSVGA